MRPHVPDQYGGEHADAADQAEVTELEAVVDEVHERFQSLDQQMSRAGQTATKIGERLQVCSVYDTCCSPFLCCQYVEDWSNIHWLGHRVQKT